MNTDSNDHNGRLSSNNLFRIRWISSWVITNGIRWTDLHSRIRFKWRSELFQLFSSLRFQWSLLELFYLQVSFNDSQAFLSHLRRWNYCHLSHSKVGQRRTSTPLKPATKILSNIYLGESFFDQIMFILFWLSLMVGSILHVIRNGPEYVNQPLLVQTLRRDEWLESVYCI